jgi:flagellar basal body rod protein FlgC
MTYGPIDFLALEFKTDQLTGEGMAELIELVEKEIVRVIDLVIILKDEDGEVQVLEIEELDPETLAIFDPLDVEVSGIIQMEDIELIAVEMVNNTTAALLLYENLWAIKFGEAITRSSGRMLMFDRIPFEVINETMEIFAEAEA